ncbi:hypothetical protein LSAT2_011340, partial [Lamellibrachia satsuma]
CDDGYFGLQCNKKCHCRGNAVCQKKYGLCDTGCDLGWKGVGCQSRSLGATDRTSCECPVRSKLVEQPSLVEVVNV